MKRILALLLLIIPAFAATAPQPGGQPEKEKSIFDLAKWRKGPAKVDVGEYATLNLKPGYVFTEGEGTRKVLEAMGNPTSGSELGFLTPTNADWFVVFRFSDVGYVKDDDKDKLNPDKLLKSIKQGTEQSNKMREKRGVPPMKIVGWEYPPKYNEATHNLEWAIRGESDGKPVVNYNTRLLGREGVMEAKLVIDPEALADTLPVFQEILADYSYKPGKSYAEFRQGDKIAKYGLAALVTGGAAAIAIKTGMLGSLILLLKKGAKLVVVAVVTVVGFIKKLFTGRSRNNAPQ
jgi:uncharacterized membrane-anchored protein